jgi:hypothetical protein
MGLKHVPQQCRFQQRKGNTSLSVILPWIPHYSQKMKKIIPDPIQIPTNFHVAHTARSSIATPTEIWCPGPQTIRKSKASYDDS